MSSSRFRQMLAGVLLCLVAGSLQADRLAIEAGGKVVIAPANNRVTVLSNGPGQDEDWGVGLVVSGLYDFVPSTETYGLLEQAPVRALGALIEPIDGKGHPVYARPGGGVLHVERGGTTTFLSGMSPVALSSGDVDDDGLDEVVAAVPGAGVFKLDLDLGTSTLIATHTAIVDLEVGKTAADGKPGVFLVASSGLVIFLNPRNGLQFPFADVNARCLRIGDLDGDGDTEIVVVTRSDQMIVLSDDGVATNAQAVTGSVDYVGDFVTFLLVAPPDDPPERPFLRLDVNDDDRIDIADPIGILQEVFQGIPGAAPCEDARDANDDGRKDISDVVYALFYLFRGGSPPPAPFPSPGLDPTPDGLAPCLAGP